MSAKKPKAGLFTITFKSFHSIRVKDLDSLYQIASRVLLGAEPPPKRRK